MSLVTCMKCGNLRDSTRAIEVDADGKPTCIPDGYSWSGLDRTPVGRLCYDCLLSPLRWLIERPPPDPCD